MTLEEKRSKLKSTMCLAITAFIPSIKHRLYLAPKVPEQRHNAKETRSRFAAAKRQPDDNKGTAIAEHTHSKYMPMYVHKYTYILYMYVYTFVLPRAKCAKIAAAPFFCTTLGSDLIFRPIATSGARTRISFLPTPPLQTPFARSASKTPFGGEIANFAAFYILYNSLAANAQA